MGDYAVLPIFLSRFESHQFVHFAFFVRFVHLRSSTMFVLDLALLIFNLERCTRTHFKGIFDGDPIII